MQEQRHTLPFRRPSFSLFLLPLLAAACTAPAVQSEWPEPPPAPELRAGSETYEPMDEGDDGPSSVWLGNATGYVLGVAAVQSTVRGEFDGNTALVGPSDVIVIPDIDSDTGFRVLFGYRWHKYAFELSYESTEHDASFAGLPNDTEFESISADFKEYWWTDSPIQPYAQFGLGMTWGEIQNGSSDGMTTQEAELEGLHANGGLGVAFHVLRHLVIDANGIYRIVRFYDATGVGGNLPINENLEGDSWIFSVGATLIL